MIAAPQAARSVGSSTSTSTAAGETGDLSEDDGAAEVLGAAADGDDPSGGEPVRRRTGALALGGALGTIALGAVLGLRERAAILRRS